MDPPKDNSEYLVRNILDLTLSIETRVLELEIFQGRSL